MINNENKQLKTELTESLRNTSVNFKHFTFRSYNQAERPLVFKFPFPKYRSFEVNAASVFYKHISRTLNV